jgi:hypothetical protein
VNDFGRLVDDAGRLLDAAVGHAEAVAADCRHWLRLLGPAAGPLDALVAALERAAADAYAQLRVMLERPGDPLALWQAADRWHDAIAAPAGARAATFTTTAVRADEHWRGRAADAYIATLPPQHRALQQVETTAAATAAMLRETAAALAAYWTAAGAALASLAGTLAAAAVASATPLTAAAGAATGLAALEEFLAVSAGLTRALTLETDRLRRAQQTTLDQLTDAAVFPGGHWPLSATATITDASLSDGDPLDWTLQP